MYNLVNDLEQRLQTNLNIINEYQVPKSTYDKTIKNIKFIDSQVNDAFKRGESEDRIAQLLRIIIFHMLKNNTTICVGI